MKDKFNHMNISGKNADANEEINETIKKYEIYWTFIYINAIESGDKQIQDSDSKEEHELRGDDSYTNK